MPAPPPLPALRTLVKVAALAEEIELMGELVQDDVLPPPKVAATPCVRSSGGSRNADG